MDDATVVASIAIRVWSGGYGVNEKELAWLGRLTMNGIYQARDGTGRMEVQTVWWDRHIGEQK